MTMANSPVITMATTTPVYDGIRVMVKEGFRRIPIVDPGTKRLRGIVTASDIVNYFGEKVLLGDNTLNRQMLRRIIITDEGARFALERFIHPEISKLIQRKMAQAEKEGDRIVLIEVPLLFELGMEDQFDVIVLVSADHGLRVQRLMDRDNVSRDEAEGLLNVQMPDEKKVELATFVLTNDGKKEQLIRSVDLLYKKKFKNT